MHRKSAKKTLLLALTAVALLSATQTVHCSSYFDLILPSAKTTLNQLSQSLGLAVPADPQQQQQQQRKQELFGETLESAANKRREEEAQLVSENQKQSKATGNQQEPNKNEFIKLDYNGDLQQPQEQQTSTTAAIPGSTVPVLSSTDATTLDPSLLVDPVETSLAGSGQKTSNNNDQQQTDRVVEEIKQLSEQQVDKTSQAAPNPIPDTQPTLVSTSTATTTTTEQVTSEQFAGSTSSELPSLSVESNELAKQTPNEAAIKETELNAVAAVDASITFGGDLFSSSLTDTCYDEYGNARYCEPEFENMAYERQVEVSSECGRPPSRFCTSYLNEISSANEQQQVVRNCHICDAQHPKKRHPATYLTDLNNPNQPTCWVSAPISVSNLTEYSSSRQLDNVTLTLNLGKSYEITYISMQFCSPKPDSLAIYKSNDFGSTWSPYQFYSSQCAKVYRKPSGPMPPGQLEATCLNSSSAGNSGQSGRIAFLTHQQQFVNQNEKSQPLLDWISATNIKLVLDKHQAGWIQSSLIGHSANSHPGNKTADSPAENSLTNPIADTFNYAMSDLTVGGRCKCNGHASRCIHSKDGQLQCDCRHNTAGPECERCAAFHHDRPWSRASQQDANPCQPCNCNGHSRKCKFDPHLYSLSGKKSGGVCLKCRNNTDGRYCHYCKEGYTRDHTKPMSDKGACRSCNCHLTGSIGNACNQTTGQCPCKEGVTGLDCSRCAPGYQQSNSPTEPCIKIPENDINYEPPSLADANGVASGDQEQDPQSYPSSNGNQNEPVPALDEQPVPSYRNRPAAIGQTRPATGSPQTNELGDDGIDDDQMGNMSPPKRPRYWPRKPHGSRYYPVDMAESPDVVDPMTSVDPGSIAADDYPAILDPDDRRRNKYVPPSLNSYGLVSRYTPSDDSYWRPHIRNSHRTRMMPKPSDDDEEDNNPNSNALSNETPYGSYGGSWNSEMDAYPNQIHQLRRGSSSGRPVRPLYRYPQQSGRFKDFEEQQSEMNLRRSRLACGECQSQTRKLSSKQFCHLDFAIKAKLLSKNMAEDWTRFEVDIQDVYKSFGSVLEANQIASSEPNKTLSEENPHQHNRIKVGSIQVIWLPTEDYACKCPKLKVGSAYLLMGLIDAKENSTNTLQLDRHGVAIEWKPALHEKLIKAQNRQAKRKC